MRICQWLLLGLVGMGFARSSSAEQGSYFKIHVVDEATGRGVPLIKLETVNKVRHWTDSNGIIAFNEPGLMGREVFFHVAGHGYRYLIDGFGYRGVRLHPRKGESATVKVRNLNVAQRLYRITGQGIYRDSVLTGHPIPTAHGTLNAFVTGQDTVIATPFRDQIYWFWGDTDRVYYPLGNFSASGAISQLPTSGGLDPSLGIDLDYFVSPDGFSKGMVNLPGKSLRWIESLMPLADPSGKEHLYARVANIRDIGYAHDWHLMRFHEDKQEFESIVRWDQKHDHHDSAHPFLGKTEDGVTYYYLYPSYRVEATLEGISNLESYEAWTCVSGAGRIPAADQLSDVGIDRDETGRPQYSWKPGAHRLERDKMANLIEKGLLSADEDWSRTLDVETGSAVPWRRGSLYWNAFRNRWIAIVTAKPGDVWFCEADTPTGPWSYARRIVQHDRYNFYNPTQHPFFDQDHGRVIFFEGTYSATFSQAAVKTPRYDYNQIMYRLQLDDARLALPAPVYRIKTNEGKEFYGMREKVISENAWDDIVEIAFYAVPPSAAHPSLIPFFESDIDGRQVVTSAGTEGNVLFHALPASILDREPTGLELAGKWECRALTPDKNAFPFTLQITGQGESRELSVSLGEIQSTEWKPDGFTISLASGGNIFEMSGRLEGRTLSGRWRKVGQDSAGSWNGKPAEDAQDQAVDFGTQALRKLCAHHVDPTQPHVYSLTQRVTDDVIGAVWKSPTTVLSFDRTASPATISSSDE